VGEPINVLGDSFNAARNRVDSRRAGHVTVEVACSASTPKPETVMPGDNVEDMELTSEILGDRKSLARISESLDAINEGDEGVDLDTLRGDVARRRGLGFVSRKR
jgi:hypothetical protein